MPEPMSEAAFLSALPEDQRLLLEKIRPWIDQADPHLNVGMVTTMGAPMLGWCAEGEFRYGFMSGNYLSFHNMVVYCHPHLHADYMGRLGVPKSRVKKSCLNLSPKDVLNEAVFRDMLKACAEATN